MILPFDIETIPNMELLSYLPPPTVSYGNAKKPELRQAKEQEAKEKQIEKMGLNPMYARLFCASFGTKKGGRIIEELNDAQETELIEWIFDVMSQDCVRLMTWNGDAFDMPFLFKRAMFLKVEPSRFNLAGLTEYTHRYNDDLHIDLMKKWDSNPKNMTKLDHVAMTLTGEGKNDIDFKYFPQMMETPEGRAEILEYNHKDSDLTEIIGLTMMQYKIF